MADPPYGEIFDLLKEGKVIPFLGSGVNFGNRTPPNASWDDKASMFLPNGSELSRFLARKSSFPSQDDHDLVDLAKVASYFVETSARRRLRERLREVFDRDCEPCKIHTYLAEINAPLLIVTTNYDNLTEEAFVKAGRPFDLVVHMTDRKEFEASVHWLPYGTTDPIAVPPNQLFIDLSTTTVIYKMHGSVNRLRPKGDSYVITEEDYVDFLSRMTARGAVPALFMRHFRTRPFLFLGYGLGDWNLRVVLKKMRNAVPSLADVQSTGEEDYDDLRSWAIQSGPSDLEVELWSARHVKVYDVEVDEFVGRLREQET